MPLLKYLGQACSIVHFSVSNIAIRAASSGPSGISRYPTITRCSRFRWWTIRMPSLKRQIGSELEATWEEGLPLYQAVKKNRWGIFYLSTKAGRLLAYILRKESWLSASMWVSNSWRTLSEAVTRRGLGDNCCGALSKTSSTSSMHSNTTWVRDENSWIWASAWDRCPERVAVGSLLLFCHEIPCCDI